MIKPWLNRPSPITAILLLLIILLPQAWASTNSATEVVKPDSTRSENWTKILKQARGQRVYFNFWGGSAAVNNYIRWAGQEVLQRYGITLEPVRVDNIATVVSRVLSEKAAGRRQNGTVDLVWINGENFKYMKDNQLLYGPFTDQLPYMALVDPQDKPTTVVDFGEPVAGFEAPWGMAQLVFIYDSNVVSKPPANAQQLLDFARKNPGRVSYPLPPDFVGTTFLKQLLLELTDEPQALSQPVNEQHFARITQPLWAYLDKLHPLLWRKGKSFPRNSLAMTPLLNDGELQLSMSFNPAYASTAINNGELPNTVRTYVHDGGTLGNSHFLAIPFNSAAKAAAQVVINFLLSPQAQLKKANSTVWGDPTVLSMSRLSLDQRRAFEQLPGGLATLSPSQLGTALTEPHSSWVPALEAAWLKRYRRGRG